MISIQHIFVITGSVMQSPKQQEGTFFWDAFAPTYNQVDSSSLTFYYTLIHMLELSSAKHILEVACGTGKLLPLALNLKSEQATFQAIDLSKAMIEMVKENISKFNQKMGVEQSIEEWMEKKKLATKVADCTAKLQTPHKFDRIIANLILHMVPDPEQMMRNLLEAAVPGCLLGVTVWGTKEKNNFFGIFAEAAAAEGKTEEGDPYCLAGKLRELGEKSGWEVVLVWQQNATFPFMSLDSPLKKVIQSEAEGNASMQEFIQNRVNHILSQKQALKFACELAIYRKK